MHGLGLKVKVNVDRVAKERLACLQTDARPAWLDDESGTDPSELRMRWRRGYCLSGERNLWSGEEGVISFGGGWAWVEAACGKEDFISALRKAQRNQGCISIICGGRDAGRAMP